MKKCRCFAAILFLIASEVVYAQPVDNSIKIIEALNATTVFEKPPFQFLSIITDPGRTLAPLPPNTKADVIDQKRISVLGHTDVWLKLRYVLPNTTEQTGWVLFGTTEGSTTFQVLR